MRISLVVSAACISSWLGLGLGLGLGSTISGWWRDRGEIVRRSWRDRGEIVGRSSGDRREIVGGWWGDGGGRTNGGERRANGRAGRLQ